MADTLKIFVARGIAAVAFFLGGGAIQLLLWKKPGDSYLNALLRHQYLWFFYFLLAVLLGEHGLKWMKRRTAR